MSAAPLTATIFAIALLAHLGLKLWLASRQIRAIARHRDQVPAAFADSISLRTHQRAADYSISRLRLGLLEIALGTAVLLASWVHRAGEDWRDRVAGWLPDHGIDAWVVQRDVADPELYDFKEGRRLGGKRQAVQTAEPQQDFGRLDVLNL